MDLMSQSRIVSKIKKIYGWNELYLTIFALYVFHAYFGTTLLSFPWPAYFDNFLRVMIISVVLLKIGYSNNNAGKLWIVCIFAVSAFWLSWLSTGYLFLFDLAILIIGAMNVSYKKILKVYFWCGTIIMSLAVTAFMTGVVRDLVYVEKGVYRHSFGICYPTDFAAHVVYLILVGFVLFDKIPLFISAGLMFLFFLFQCFYCVTECSEIVMLLSIAGVAYVGLAPRIKNKESAMGRLVQLIDQCMAVFIVFCAGVIICLSLWYNEDDEVLRKINSWISNRLYLAKSAFETYGIKPFGTAFDMIGGGNETIIRPGYNFVDSSFCMILVRYGWIVLLAVFLIYFIVERKALKAGDRKLMVAFALISVHSAIEHHLLELAYNPLILLPLSDINLKMGISGKRNRRVHRTGNKQEQRQNEKQAECKKQNYINGKNSHGRRKWMGYGIGCVILIFMSPGILRYGKTLVTLLRLNEPSRNWYFIFAILFVAGAVIGLVKGIVDIAVSWIEKRLPSRMEVCLAVGSGIFLMAAAGGSELLMRQKAMRYEESLAVGEKIISCLQEKEPNKYRIYVDDIPELYHRQVGGIAGRVFSADSAGAGSHNNTVVITGKNRDIKRLIEVGFWFGEFSDQEGIYTDSEEAIQILKENGIAMNNFYSARKEVNLADLAGRNGLPINERGSLLVEGADKSLIYGSYDVVYKGLLRVEYRLRLLDSSIMDGELATVRLAREWGRYVVKEASLTRTDFDEDGYCTAVIEEQIPDSEGVECLLFAKGDTKIEIESISFRKVRR